MAGICSYGVDGAGVGFHLGNQGAIVDFPELQEPRPAAADKALTSRQEIQSTDPVFVSIGNRLHSNTHTQTYRLIYKYISISFYMQML